MCKGCVGNVTKIYWNHGGVSVKSFNLPCNKWSCEECAKRKAIILGNRVKEGFKGERIRFATFTDNGEGSLCERLKMLKTAWNRLRLDLSRKHGLTKFFWVLEFGGKRGRPHLHCLLNCYIPQRELSRLASKAGFGSIADIREVKDGGGFGYVFKYLSKDCGLKAGASALRAIGGRRFGLSRNIPPVKTNSQASCVALLSRDILADDVLLAHSKCVASVLGSEFKVEKPLQSNSAVAVPAAFERWAKPTDPSLFTNDYKSWERLVLFGGARWHANGSRWARNAWERMSENDIFNPQDGSVALLRPLQISHQVPAT